MDVNYDKEPIFIITNLVKSYPSQDVFSNISFNLHKGEVIGLMGSSGSGKGTL